MRHLFVLTLCATIAAQDPHSNTPDAEQRYQEAYWAEVGQGDLEAALQGYLAAAEATGAGAFRAKALLRAAELQHRMGRDAEALATIDKLLARFPDQSDVAALARARRAEWQEVDLRKNYSEWYHKQLFTPEVQAKVLELVKQYAGFPESPGGGRARTKEDRERVREHEAQVEALERQILTFGVGAVPALEQLARTAATAQDPLLAKRTCGLLLRLGAVPPAEALLADHSWARQPSSWRTLMRADSATKRQLAAACGRVPGALAEVLRTLALGDAAVLDLIAGVEGGALAVENESAAEALIAALHRFGGDEVHAAIVELSKTPGRPVAVQRIAELTVANHGWRGATAADWYEWSTDRLRTVARLAAIRHACSRLRGGDQDVLRAILADLDGLEPYLVYGYHEALTAGLSLNPVPMQLPWTADLAHTLLLHIPGEVGSGYGLGRWRTTTTGRAMLAESILRTPAEVVRRMQAEDSGFHPSLLYSGYWEDDEYEMWRLEDAWADELTRQIRARWEDWSKEDRLAVLELLVTEEGEVELLSTERPFPEELRTFLSQQAASGPQGEQIKAALQRIAEAWGEEDTGEGK